MSKMKEKLKPILDEKITKHLNLTVLQRIDPCVQEIIAGATHVAIYEFDIDTLEWSRKNVQGTLFVVKRNTEPHFQFLVMNRKSTENLVESLWGNFEYEVHGPYVLYRNHCKEVNGIWFYDTKECEEISNLFGRILNEYYEEPTKLKVSSREIKVEKDDTLEPSSTAIAKVEKDDQSCVKVPSLSQSSTALISDPPTSLPAPAPVTSPTVKFPVLENSEPEVSKACRTDLVKPSSFLSPRPSCSHVMPPITSFAPPPPTSPLISPGNLKRPYGTLLLPLFPPPTSPQSLTPTYATTYMQFSREKVRKALQSLIQDNQFIEIVYRAVMNATED
ncbi:mRNA-decapping enzyme-like protein isoform X2 [Salvia splendens]|uniref:mRNA-decapping enzyme-like protein isoform X2 n=1 Tax=Salvia splendens TaxID=180675 RepID=UPI001C27EA1D|nr:mRNA-decapping enzyme-like protein isoform X2 [Salvia splendens]